jgi:hypothetical protein
MVKLFSLSASETLSQRKIDKTLLVGLIKKYNYKGDCFDSESEEFLKKGGLDWGFADFGWN